MEIQVFRKERRIPKMMNAAAATAKSLSRV